MAAISALMVKDLRERTGLGMMECKKALVEADGNIEQAIEDLRKAFAAYAEPTPWFADLEQDVCRDTVQRRFRAAYAVLRVGVLELLCECIGDSVNKLFVWRAAEEL